MAAADIAVIVALDGSLALLVDHRGVLAHWVEDAGIVPCVAGMLVVVSSSSTSMPSSPPAVVGNWPPDFRFCPSTLLPLDSIVGACPPGRLVDPQVPLTTPPPPPDDVGLDVVAGLGVLVAVSEGVGISASPP